jgi:hypothetical protein
MNNRPTFKWDFFFGFYYFFNIHVVTTVVYTNIHWPDQKIKKLGHNLLLIF